MTTTTIATGTPVISVTDNRGICVRTLNWNRTQAEDNTTLLVTQIQVPDDSLTALSRDPRLFAAWQADSTSGANLTSWGSLTAQRLRRDSTDSGQDVVLFDAEGNPAWARDPAGTVIQWAYDVLGRPISVLQQASGAAKASTAAAFIYGDNDVQAVKPQDNNLRGVCVRQYDEGGRLTTDSVALSAAVLSASQTFLLDAETLPDWPASETGRSDLLETTEYLTTVVADALGCILSQTDGAGHSVSLAYDVSGVPVKQMVQLKGQATPLSLLNGLTLSAAGQVLSERAGNGVETSYGYVPETLRLSSIVAVRSSDSMTLQSLGYAYDPVGNVTSVSDATVSAAWYRNQATAGARTFTYDALNQLIRATGRENAGNGAQSRALPTLLPTDDAQYVNYTRTYSYDNGGNLNLLTHSGAVNSTMAMVTDSMSNRSIRQDRSGSLTPDTVVWNDWFTPGGQLMSLQTEGGKPANGFADSADPLLWDRNTCLQTVTLLSRSDTDINQNDREVYQYRGGMRVRKQTRTLTNSGTGLWTVSEVRYLPGLELCNSWQETVSALGSRSVSYTEQLEVVTTQAGRSQIRVLHWVSTPPSGISNDQIRYGVDDNLGSMQLELDNKGYVISREEYYPFGGTAVWASRSALEANYKTVRYSGKERDVTGLYYYGYRYYAPWLCRWTASDPAHEIDGLNLFRMVKNDPTTLLDINGLENDSKRSSHTAASPVGRVSRIKGNSIFMAYHEDKKTGIRGGHALERHIPPHGFDSKKYAMKRYADNPNYVVGSGAFISMDVANNIISQAINSFNPSTISSGKMDEVTKKWGNSKYKTIEYNEEIINKEGKIKLERKSIKIEAFDRKNSEKLDRIPMTEEKRKAIYEKRISIKFDVREVSPTANPIGWGLKNRSDYLKIINETDPSKKNKLTKELIVPLYHVSVIVDMELPARERKEGVKPGIYQPKSGNRMRIITAYPK